MTTENFKKLLPYLGIFFVLFMGSGLVKIPVGSALFYVIKFGIIIGVLGIGVWTWYKAKTNHQPPTAYLQLALFVPFTIDFHLHYAFIFLTIILFNKKLLLPWNSPLKPIYLLFILGFISYIINQFIEFNPLSFPLFVNTFFLPTLFISLFYSNTTETNKKELVNFFFSLIGFMSFVILMQTIVYWNLHPDLRDGGVSSVHMAGAFISLAAIIIYFKTFNDFKLKKNNTLGLVITSLLLLILFLIDAKYILFALVVTVFISEMLFNFGKNKIKYIVLLIFLILGSVLMYTTNQRIILSILSFDDQDFRTQNVINDFNKSPRGQLLGNGLKLPVEEPLVFFLGSGPGTFLSRATESRSKENYEKWLVEFEGPAKSISKPLRSLIANDETWIQKKYLKNFEKNKHYYSSIMAPNGGLISFYFEFGIIGIVILFYFLWSLFQKAKINFNTKVSYSIIVFMILIFLFGNWLEFTNFQILSYSLIGLQLSIGNK